MPTPYPLPRPYQGDMCFLTGAGGGLYSIISFQRGAWRPPFDNPPLYGNSVLGQKATKDGGSQRGRLLTCRFGRSLDAPHRGAATPFGIRLYKTVPLPYCKGTDYSFCPLTGGGRGWVFYRLPHGRRGGRAPCETGAGGWPDVFINEVDCDLKAWYNRFNSLTCYLSKIPDAHKKPPRGRRFEE